MKRSALLLGVVWALISINQALAYDATAHKFLTLRALDATTLEDRLPDWGLSDSTSLIDDYTFTISLSKVGFCGLRLVPVKIQIKDIIAEGAFCEDMTLGDSQPARYRNHFYDPAHGGKGLTFGQQWQSSLVWGLNSNAVPFQNYAYGDAKNYLVQSFTAAAEVDRKVARSRFFRSLGHLMHLVEDLGQPQHTREDNHAAGSPFEDRTDFLFTASRGSLALDDYGAVVAPQWSDFWSTVSANDPQDGIGLADYTNSQFVSQGRNFRGTPQNVLPNDYEPHPDGTSVTLEAPVDASTLDCLADKYGNSSSGFVTFMTLHVYDRYAHKNIDVNHAVSLGINSADLQDPSLNFTGKGAFALNNCNFDAMVPALLPATIGYTAGLLQYIIRGQMSISVPDAGFYGLVDHALFAPNQQDWTPTDPNNGFRGFNKIKLKLANTTMPIAPPGATPLPQDMSQGTVTAVLSFHRNTCYDDLLLNWPATSLDAKDCISTSEEIVVSNPLTGSIPFASDGTPPDITFDFPVELPINAWSVVLHVIYRGKLGSEDDAVVVATKDISEPTFTSFFNATDYVILDGHFRLPTTITQSEFVEKVNPGCRTVGEDGSYMVDYPCYNITDGFTFTSGASTVSLAAVGAGAISPRHFARFALLAEVDAPPLFSWNVGGVTCWLFLSDPLSIQPYRAQLDSDGQLEAYGDPNVFRGINAWTGSFCYSDIGLTPSDPTSLNYGELSNLTNNEKSPVPITITGW